MCESHAHTSKNLVLNGPRFSADYLPQYLGPRDYVSHVNNFFYGENESGTDKIDNNKGSTQFWRMLGCFAYDFDYVESGMFGREILKGGNDNLKSRLANKFKLLQNLKARGIWLVDTNIFGWYMTQTTEYVQSKVSMEVVKKPEIDHPLN